MDERCVCQEIQRHFLDRAFERLKLKEAERGLLLSSFRETQVTVPVTHEADRLLQRRGVRIVPDLARKREIDMRTAAYELAIMRVHHAIQLRGF